MGCNSRKARLLQIEMGVLGATPVVQSTHVFAVTNHAPVDTGLDSEHPGLKDQLNYLTSLNRLPRLNKKRLWYVKALLV